MKEENTFTRQYACQCLGVAYNASLDEIKRAYREKVKFYHPDANLQVDTTQIYVVIQKAYEYLVQNPYTTASLHHENMAYSSNMYTRDMGQVKPRTVRVFGNDAKVTSQYQRQKQVQKEREKVKQWEAEKRKKAEQLNENAKNRYYCDKELTKEQEILQRIKAIWIAENIKRQIAMEKERIEAENKRKLYRAFMQQKMHQDEIDIQNNKSL